MARAHKSGKRTASGRLKRDNYAEPTYDRGTEQAQERRARFHGNGYDAIGRAYSAGLLGEGAQAKARLDTARKMATLYNRIYARRLRSCLNDQPRGGPSNAPERPGEAERQNWLKDALDAVTDRRAFDQLVLDERPDGGPIWLDRLIVWRDQPAQCRAERRIMTDVLAELDAICSLYEPRRAGFCSGFA